MDNKITVALPNGSLVEGTPEQIAMMMAAMQGFQAAQSTAVVPVGPVYDTQKEDTSMPNHIPAEAKAELVEVVATVSGIFTPDKKGEVRYALNGGTGYVGRAYHQDGTDHVQVRFGVTYRDGKPVDTKANLVVAHLKDDVLNEWIMEQIEESDYPTSLQFKLKGWLWRPETPEGEVSKHDKVLTNKKTGEVYLAEDWTLDLVEAPVVVKRGEPGWVITYTVEVCPKDAMPHKAVAKVAMKPWERLALINEQRLAAAREEETKKSSKAAAKDGMNAGTQEAADVQEWG